MTLFLDFDGVLNSVRRDGPDFFKAPMLWEILRACSNVRVVFSTSWRGIFPFTELVVFVTDSGGKDLAHRFVGSTPSIYREPGAYIAGRQYKREDECREWLRHNGGEDQPWLAIDDDDEYFRGPNLYLVDQYTGLTEADVAAIIAICNSASPGKLIDQAKDDLAGIP